jgi:hypothetical protein
MRSLCSLCRLWRPRGYAQPTAGGRAHSSHDAEHSDSHPPDTARIETKYACSFPESRCVCIVLYAALEGCEVMDSSEFEIGAGFGTDPGVEAEGAASSTVLAIRHHLRSVHIFRFGDAGVCAAWRAQLQRVCKETTWRGEERLQEEQREKDSKGQGGGGRGPGAGEEAAAAERLRPAGGKLAEVAAEAAREAAWTNEADEAFKLKFKEAQAKPDYGWGPADLLAVRMIIDSHTLTHSPTRSAQQRI